MAKKADVKCKQCGETDLSLFGRRKVGGRVYPRHLCKKCFNRSRDLRRKANPVSWGNKKERRSKKRAEERRLGVNLWRIILKDTVSSDRKRGFSNDLDTKFIQDPRYGREHKPAR